MKLKVTAMPHFEMIIAAVIVSVLWSTIFWVFANEASNQELVYQSMLGEMSDSVDNERITHITEKKLRKETDQMQVMMNCSVNGFHIMTDHNGTSWLLDCKEANVKNVSDEELKEVKAKKQKRQ